MYSCFYFYIHKFFVCAILTFVSLFKPGAFNAQQESGLIVFITLVCDVKNSARKRQAKSRNHSDSERLLMNGCRNSLVLFSLVKLALSLAILHLDDIF